MVASLLIGTAWALTTSYPAPSVYPSKLTILHTNDIHAHLDSFNKGGTECRPADIKSNTCYGGIARFKTVIDAYRKNTSNVILLDAGDQFQGTLFFNYYNATPTAEFMNELKYDAMCIGNHEFDHGEVYLNEFINMLKFPVISSNMELSKSKMAHANVKPYTIIQKYNLGIIGFITNTTGHITMNTQDIIFSNPVPIVQKYIDELQKKGIKRIIALSHNGYADDKYLAENTKGLHLIVGGHSHSLLLKNLTVDQVEGPYPTTVKNMDGRTTFIVQAHRYGDYLGHVDLEWDSNNNLISLQGDPILMDASIAKDPMIDAQVQKLREAFLPLTMETIAVSTAAFPACIDNEECAMGELIAQCMLKNSKASFAWTNSGGIRADFPSGNISVADVMTTLPFGNTIAQYSATGQEIWDMVLGVIQLKNIKTGISIISHPQWAGLTYHYALNPSRVVNIKIGDKALALGDKYDVLTNDFAAGGGDAIIAPVTFVPGDVLADTVIACLKEKKVISPTVLGNVVKE